MREKKNKSLEKLRFDFYWRFKDFLLFAFQFSGSWTFESQNSCGWCWIPSYAHHGWSHSFLSISCTHQRAIGSCIGHSWRCCQQAWVKIFSKTAWTMPNWILKTPILSVYLNKINCTKSKKHYKHKYTYPVVHQSVTQRWKYAHRKFVDFQKWRGKIAIHSESSKKLLSYI